MSKFWFQPLKLRDLVLSYVYLTINVLSFGFITVVGQGMQTGDTEALTKWIFR